MSVNEKMTAIANAIRAHTGGTDALTLDAMAEAIASIEAGGGGCVAGSFTLAETTTDPIVITHNFGKIPALAVLTAEYSTDSKGFFATNTLLVAVNVDGDNSYRFRARRSSSSSASYQLSVDTMTNTNAAVTFNNATNSTINIQSSSTFIITAGIPYHYAILKELT